MLTEDQKQQVESVHDMAYYFAQKLEDYGFSIANINDAAQNCLLRLCDRVNRGLYDESRPFGTFAGAIFKTAIIDYIRTEGHYRSKFAQFGLPSDYVNKPFRPHRSYNGVAWEELQRLTNSAIEAGIVTRKDVEILFLSCIDGLIQRAIGKQYDISRRRVNFIVKRTKQRLQQYMHGKQCLPSHLQMSSESL